MLATEAWSSHSPTAIFMVLFPYISPVLWAFTNMNGLLQNNTTKNKEHKVSAITGHLTEWLLTRLYYSLEFPEMQFRNLRILGSLSPELT